MKIGKTISMGDDLHGRRPKWKTITVEDNLSGRRPQWNNNNNLFPLQNLVTVLKQTKTKLCRPPSGITWTSINQRFALHWYSYEILIHAASVNQHYAF